MKRITVSFLVGTCATLVVFAVLVHFWFRGYFDPGKFEIEQIRWSPTKQAAILAKRSDQQSLGGLTYFVLIGNHLLSPPELRRAYHSDNVIFATARDCFTIQWESEDKLSIKCDGTYLSPEFIDVEKHKQDGVTISYFNVSSETAQSFKPK